MPNNIVIKFTKDYKQISQYARVMQIINSTYVSDINSNFFNNIEELRNFLLLYKHQVCIGGAILSVCKPNIDLSMLLSKEIRGFWDNSIFLSDAFGIMSNLTIYNKQKNVLIFEKLIYKATQKFRQLGIRYIFIPVNRKESKQFLRNYRKFGYNVQLLYNKNTNYFGDYEYVMILDLKASNRQISYNFSGMCCAKTG